MRFEASLLATSLVASASATNIWNHQDTHEGSSKSQSLDSDDDHKLRSFFLEYNSIEVTESVPSEHVFERFHVTPKLPIDSTYEEMDTVGTLDLGVLEQQLPENDELNVALSGAPADVELEMRNILGEKLLEIDELDTAWSGDFNRPGLEQRNLDWVDGTNMDCEAYCLNYGSSPVIEVSGENLHDVISSCTKGEEDCPYNIGIPLNCWNVSKVTNMSFAFAFLYDGFNEPLNCWDVSQVKEMNSMFYMTDTFNQNINDWDVSRVESMEYLFALQYFNQPLDQWDVSKVTSMKYMFGGGPFAAGYYPIPHMSVFNQPLNQWDVSKVEDMSWMFNHADSFNQPLSDWNVAKVTTMTQMFSHAFSFNQCLASWKALTSTLELSDKFFEKTLCESASFSGCEAYCANFNRPEIEVSGLDFKNVLTSCYSTAGDCPFDRDIPLNCWDVSKVTDMTQAFYMRSNFNQPLNCWNVSRVESMKEMFANSDFNQAINEWNVSKVTDMASMFSTTYFNQPLKQWNVSKVRDMAGIFSFTTRFNQPIDKWDVSEVTDMHGMFWYAESFNQCINNWDVSKVTDLRQTFYTAKVFNQCLASWKALTLGKGVAMDLLFKGSGCESTSISDGIWCNSNCSLPVMVNSSAPTNPPTTSPSTTHSLLPTDLPIFETTTNSPTTNPTVTHSLVPTDSPTTNPTVTHSLVPTNSPTTEPTVTHSLVPTDSPTTNPTVTPSLVPTNSPTTSPTLTPRTESPTFFPTYMVETWSETPSLVPTDSPTTNPTVTPSLVPTISPTTSPTLTQRTESPTFFPTYMVETWSDIVLLEKEGVTDFPEKGISIIEQSTSKVTVAFKQAFTTSNRTIHSVYYQYQVSSFDRECFEKQTVPGGDTTSITIQCYTSSPVALLEVWIADNLENNVLSKDCNATIPNCCHPTVPKEMPVSKFLFQIKCESAFDEGSVV